MRNLPWLTPYPLFRKDLINELIATPAANETVAIKAVHHIVPKNPLKLANTNISMTPFL